MEVQQVITTFQKYIKEWHELDVAYYRIPSWRWIKQLQNIRKREQLTRVFVARIKHHGVIK